MRMTSKRLVGLTRMSEGGGEGVTSSLSRRDGGAFLVARLFVQELLTFNFRNCLNFFNHLSDTNRSRGSEGQDRTHSDLNQVTNGKVTMKLVFLNDTDKTCL